MRKKQPKGIQENKIQGILADEEKADVQKSKARSNDSNTNLRLVVGRLYLLVCRGTSLYRFR